MGVTHRARLAARRQLGVDGIHFDGTLRRWYVSVTIDAIGTGLTLPVILLYFTRVDGISVVGVGTAISAATGAALIASPVIGSTVDRFGPRRMVVAGLLVNATCCVSYLFTTSWGALALITAINQIANQTGRTARQTFLASFAASPDRVRLLAVQRSLRNAGYAVGGLVAAAAMSIGPSSFRWLIVIDALSYAAAALLVRAMPDGTPAAAPEPKQEQPTGGSPYRDFRYLALASGNTLILIQVYSCTFAVPLWVSGHTLLPVSMAGVLLTLNTVIVVCWQIPLSRGFESLTGARTLYPRVVALTCLAGALYLLSGRLEPIPFAAVAIVVAVVSNSGAEVYSYVAGWTVSVALAPATSPGRYLAVFTASDTAAKLITPALVSILLATYPEALWPVQIVLVGLGCALSRLALPHSAAERSTSGVKRATR
ncbi:MFS transporter [Nocardia sp. NPDC052566]|uniref:MFS transporter n=1 Tax=Nocardia sp. NPDC052566 TaxID=3364330 RepID=UPI0037CAC7C6